MTPEGSISTNIGCYAVLGARTAFISKNICDKVHRYKKTSVDGLCDHSLAAFSQIDADLMVDGYAPGRLAVSLAHGPALTINQEGSDFQYHTSWLEVSIYECDFIWRAGIVQSSEPLQKRAELFERIAVCFGAFVAVGVLTEVGMALAFPPYGLCPIQAVMRVRLWLDAIGAATTCERWGNTFADVFIFVGVIGEVLFSRLSSKCANELQHRAESETNRLRAKYAPRELTKEQCECLESLRGTLGAITLIPWMGSESAFFATQFAIALEWVGAQVTINRWYTGPAGNGLLIALPFASGLDPREHPLTKAFEQMGLTVAAELRKPDTYSNVPATTTVIQVGETFNAFDSAPYVSQLPNASKWVKA